MADVDLLPARGIRGYVIVADTGIASGGTLNVLQLAQRGMRAYCEVDATGLSSGSSLTVLQLAARGIRAFCQVNELGINAASGATIAELQKRGVNPLCCVTALGVAQGGSATTIELSRRGISFFCPLNESGNETSLAAYSGPGDIVASAVSWWGLRAYSNATKTTNLVRIRRVSDNAEQDFASLSTGALDRASISTFLAATTGRFVTFYDQISTAHLTQATAANQAVVNLSGVGSLVTADFSAAVPHTYATGANYTRAQPFTGSFVAKAVNIATAQRLWGDGLGGGGSVQSGFDFTGANLAWMYAGSVKEAAAADGSFHAVQAVFNGASSDLNINGTVNTVDPGAGGFGGGNPFHLGHVGAATPFNGSWCELGIWAAAFTSTQSSNMSSNQHTYWGF